MKPEIIYIEKYDARIVNGKIAYFAIAKNKEYPMPPCYADMYDNDHLAIRKRVMLRPELFELTEDDAEHYIPLRTAKV